MKPEIALPLFYRFFVDYFADRWYNHRVSKREVSMSLKDRKKALVEKAKAKYGKIYPLIMGSWTEEGGILFFWFNDAHDSTKIVHE